MKEELKFATDLGESLNNLPNLQNSYNVINMRKLKSDIILQSIFLLISRSLARVALLMDKIAKTTDSKKKKKLMKKKKQEATGCGVS